MKQACDALEQAGLVRRHPGRDCFTLSAVQVRPVAVFRSASFNDLAIAA
jgi:hypothetical protein